MDFTSGVTDTPTESHESEEGFSDEVDDDEEITIGAQPYRFEPYETESSDSDNSHSDHTNTDREPDIPHDFGRLQNTEW